MFPLKQFVISKAKPRHAFDKQSYFNDHKVHYLLLSKGNT